MLSAQWKQKLIKAFKNPLFCLLNSTVFVLSASTWILDENDWVFGIIWSNFGLIYVCCKITTRAISANLLFATHSINCQRSYARLEMFLWMSRRHQLFTISYIRVGELEQRGSCLCFVFESSAVYTGYNISAI